MVMNWQTTIGGVLAILTIIYKMWTGELTVTDIGLAGVAVSALRAKDKGVTGAGDNASRPPK